MSENKKDKVPMEFPSKQQSKKVDPIVDVVENELNPPMNAQVQQIVKGNCSNQSK